MPTCEGLTSERSKKPDVVRVKDGEVPVSTSVGATLMEPPAGWEAAVTACPTRRSNESSSPCSTPLNVATFTNGLVRIGWLMIALLNLCPAAVLGNSGDGCRPLIH